MLPTSINHMTVAQRSAVDLLDMAKAVNCVGIELRRDLPGDVFGGLSAAAFGARAQSSGLRILCLAEVSAFNDGTDAALTRAYDVIEQAAACCAEAIALIPYMSEAPLARTEQRRALRTALDLIRPALDAHQITGLIEPLGFAHSSLRYKADVADVLTDMGNPACFGLLHDTFHHHLADEADVFPDLTALVHISGVEAQIPIAEMEDSHRVLVSRHDRLGNIEQIKALQQGGYTDPLSFEAFATAIHELVDPAAAVAVSQSFIASELAEELV